jgi:hypothetical protein
VKGHRKANKSDPRLKVEASQRKDKMEMCEIFGLKPKGVMVLVNDTWDVYEIDDFHQRRLSSKGVWKHVGTYKNPIPKWKKQDFKKGALFMGIDVSIGSPKDKDFASYRISNATNFESMLNHVAKFGNFPELINRSWFGGKIKINHKGPATLWDSGVKQMLEEVSFILEEVPLNESDEYILKQIVKACKKSLQLKKDIVLYY